MVSPRGGKQIPSVTAPRQTEAQNSNNLAKKRASASKTEDKENKKPKTGSSDYPRIRDDSGKNQSDKVPLHTSEASANTESIIPSVEETERKNKPQTPLLNPFPETWSGVPEHAEQSRDRRPTPGRNHAALTDPKLRV